MKSEEFIREVDEDLRRDQMKKLWLRYGSVLIALAVLAVAGTAGKVAWDHWRQQERAAEALRFVAADDALEAARDKEAADQFAALAAEGKTGFVALARLKEAEAKLALKDQPGAITALDDLSATANDGPILRELGVLLAAERQLETADPAELTRALEPLASGDAPWRNQARELLALLAIRTGDLAKARQILEELSKEVGVPPSQQRRADELLQAIGGPATQASS